MRPQKLFSIIFISFLLGKEELTFSHTLKGRLLEKGTAVPLKEVNVYLMPLKLKTQTNLAGDFEFLDVLEGEYQLLVNLSGYKKLEFSVDVDKDLKKRKYFVEKDSYLSFETTVVGEKQKRDQSQRTLTREQFLSLPGSGGDPVKAVQNLPGVNRVQGFSSQVVIQGSEPKDTKYNIDGHEIPLVFHFGGLTSVVMPEALAQVNYLSAGYGADFSRATGGIIGLITRDPEPGERKKKSLFFLDNLKLGGLYESQVDENTSYLISGRLSYVGLFLAQVAKGRDDFNLTVAPEFFDITGIYHKKLAANEDFNVITIASRDTLSFVLKEPFKADPAFRGNFFNETQFYRFIPQWQKKITQDSSLKLSAGLGQDQVIVDVGSQYFNLLSEVLTVRGEYEEKLSQIWSTQVGIDNSYSRAKVRINLVQPRGDGGVSNPFASSDVKQREVSGSNANIGLYNRHELHFNDWTWIPGLRIDRFKSTGENFISPRLAVKWNYTPSLLLKSASGVYYQPPEPQETDDVFGNPNVKSPQALHTTLGFEKDFRGNSSEGFTWQSQYFDKWLNHLVVNSSDSVERDGALVNENYSNRGGGRAYGIETQLKWSDALWDIWLGYTWGESFRWTDQIQKYRHEYDQTHNLNLVASKKFSSNWKVSGRFRYVTGNPFTPVLGGTFDADNDVYLPQRGSFFSERYKDFYQLDLRIDKKSISDEEIWTFYLDIQNILNTKNVESIEYSYNYKERGFISGLPFLPAFGIKGEF